MKWRKSNNAKRVSHGCRNNGSCKVCEGNRTYQARRALLQASEDEADVKASLGRIHANCW